MFSFSRSLTTTIEKGDRYMSTGNVSGIKWVDEASQSHSLLCFKKKKPFQASDRTA